MFILAFERTGIMFILAFEHALKGSSIFFKGK